MSQTLLPDLAENKLKPAFTSVEDFERYKTDFMKALEEDLEEQRKARIASEEDMLRKVIK